MSLRPMPKIKVSVDRWMPANSIYIIDKDSDHPVLLTDNLDTVRNALEQWGYSAFLERCGIVPYMAIG